MGYYSIYKILKDMIKTLFGKRFLRLAIITLILACILVFLDKNGVFAKTQDVEIYINSTSNGTVTFPSWIIDNNYKWVLTASAPISSKPGLVYFNMLVVDGSFYYDTSNSVFVVDGVIKNPNWGFMGGSFSLLEDRIENSVEALEGSSSSLSPAYQFSVLKTNTNIYDQNGNLWRGVTDPNLPSDPIFYNKQNFIDFVDNSLVIYPQDYGVDVNLFLHFLTVDSIIQDSDVSYYYYKENVFSLNRNSKYYDIDTETTFKYYNIPRSVFALENNKNYIFYLSASGDSTGVTTGLYDFSGDFDGFSLDTSSQNITAESTIIDNQQNQNDKLDEIGGFLTDNNYDGNTVGDTLGGVTNSTDDVDDSVYTGLFSAIFSKFSNIVNGDFSSVEEIRYPVPNTDEYITITSDLLSSKIEGTFIYVFLQITWYFIFGLYIFKFSNNLIKKIKDGSILNGYENDNEVITSSML